MATPTPTASWVLCEVFGEPHAKIIEVQVATALDERSDAADLLREAITGIEAVAARASDEEQEDLMTLAGQLDDAALHADYNHALDVWEGFFDKYAEACAEPTT